MEFLKFNVIERERDLGHALRIWFYLDDPILSLFQWHDPFLLQFCHLLPPLFCHFLFSKRVAMCHHSVAPYLLVETFALYWWCHPFNPSNCWCVLFELASLSFYGVLHNCMVGSFSLIPSNRGIFAKWRTLGCSPFSHCSTKALAPYYLHHLSFLFGFHCICELVTSSLGLCLFKTRTFEPWDLCQVANIKLFSIFHITRSECLLLTAYITSLSFSISFIFVGWWCHLWDFAISKLELSKFISDVIHIALLVLHYIFG